MPWDGTRPDTGKVSPTALCFRQIMLMAYTRTIPTRHARRIGHIREMAWSSSTAPIRNISGKMVFQYQLGNISTTQVSVNTVDIGLAQLAMHSPYETGSVKDTDYMIQAMKTFFEASVRQTEDGYELISR